MNRDSVHRISIGLRALSFVLGLALLSACTAIPIEQREARRAEIDQDAEETIALLIERDPKFAEALEQSAGYFTSRVSSATAALAAGPKASAYWSTTIPATAMANAVFIFALL